MHGNVWEWCWDGHESYAREQALDPIGPSRATDRVYRGAGWDDDPRGARSAFRSGYAPDDRDNDLGFRVARSL